LQRIAQVDTFILGDVSPEEEAGRSSRRRKKKKERADGEKERENERPGPDHDLPSMVGALNSPYRMHRGSREERPQDAESSGSSDDNADDTNESVSGDESTG
jgi:hypothetical protein